MVNYKARYVGVSNGEDARRVETKPRAWTPNEPRHHGPKEQADDGLSDLGRFVFRIGAMMRDKATELFAKNPTDKDHG